jgi:7,8-dihydro-6-hydroxymethylpterin-pyrophosphokinase
VFSNEVVTVPHPDMLNRDFVLAPLAEIAAKFVHPVAHKTIEVLWQELQAKQEETAQDNK